MTKIIDVEHL